MKAKISFCLYFIAFLALPLVGEISDLSGAVYSHLDSNSKKELDLSKFETPVCLVGNPGMTLSKRARLVRQMQKGISRKREDFRKNKSLERRFRLKGTAKYTVRQYAKKESFSPVEEEFLFFAMTLFGEARNLDEEGIEMVARVINNRRKGRSYVQTVTQLAQFSAWYYKHTADNAVLLCPSYKQYKNWKKVIKVAYEQFLEEDDFLQSSHYFAPRNMRPRNRIPQWAKDNLVVRFGGHVFLVNQDFRERNSTDELEVAYIKPDAKKIFFSNGHMVIH